MQWYSVFGSFGFAFQNLNPVKSNCKITRILLGLLCVSGLVTIYLFQHWDITFLFRVENSDWKFVLGKSVRFFLNDLLMIGLLFALFFERKYVIFAFWIQLAGVVLFLIPYFVLKLVFHAGNGPLVSFLHRLVLNPTLLLLLIPAFYYQKSKSQ